GVARKASGRPMRTESAVPAIAMASVCSAAAATIRRNPKDRSGGKRARTNFHTAVVAPGSKIAVGRISAKRQQRMSATLNAIAAVKRRAVKTLSLREKYSSLLRADWCTFRLNIVRYLTLPSVTRCLIRFCVVGVERFERCAVDFRRWLIKC